MEDFKFMVSLLAAIQAQEGAAVFDTSYISESVLQTTAQKRDMLAYKQNKDGYIDGLFVVDECRQSSISIYRVGKFSPVCDNQGSFVYAGM